MPNLLAASTDGGFGTKTLHQQLQLNLSIRDRGGPHEQSASAPARLRRTRGTEVLHSSLSEPLSSYKSLEPRRPRWPSTFRRLHLTDGFRVVDHDTIVVSARDQIFKCSQKGQARTSSGYVTYSATHCLKAEIDVEMLASLVKEGVPRGGHHWTPKVLERIFRERTGRQGSWAHYGVPFKEFLRLFPRTFEMFGPKDDFVRSKNGGMQKILDNVEDAMVLLAKAREEGFVDHHNHADKAAATVGGQGKQTVALPALHQHRVKAVFKPFAA